MDARAAPSQNADSGMGLLRAGWRAFMRQPGEAIRLVVLEAVLALAALVAGGFVNFLMVLPVWGQVSRQESPSLPLMAYLFFAMLTAALAMLFVGAPLFAGMNLAFYKLAEGKEPGGSRHLSAAYRSFWKTSKSFLLTLVLLTLPLVCAALTMAVLMLTAEDYVPKTRGEGGWVFEVALIVLVPFGTLAVASGLTLVPVMVLDRKLSSWQAVRASWRAMRGHKRQWIGAMTALTFFALLVSWIPLVNVVALLVLRSWMLCASAVLRVRILAASGA